jgi:LPS-assembly protein
MCPFLPIVVAIVAAQAPVSAQGNPDDQMVHVTADELTYDKSGDLLIARGHAILRTSKVSMWADEMQYDRAHQHAWARGNVMMVSGFTTAVGDEVEADLQTDEVTIKGGLLLQKRNVKPELLAGATTPEQLKRMGQTTLIMTGDYIKRVEPDHFDVKHLSFTPCDCDLNRPSWHIESVWADVESGERAILWLPVIYLHQRLPIIAPSGSLPVLPLPVLYLPLKDRRSGLLVPRPSWGVLNGFTIDVPLYVTLGRSYDVTLTPGYYSGASKNADGSYPSPYGVKGGRLQTEFRYVPSSQTSGRFSVGLLNDLRDQRDPTDPNKPLLLDQNDTSTVVHRHRGLRWEGSLQHDQDLGGGFFDRVDAFVVSDGYYVRDLQADILARENQYLRSTAVLFHRDSDTYAGLDVAYRQDLRWGYSIFNNDRLPDGTLLRGPNTLQRIPGLIYDVPERRWAGPIFGAIHLEYARIAPLVGNTGDEGTDGVFDPGNPDPDGSQGDRKFQPGEREARDRIDFRPHLSASFPLGRYARLTPYAAYREDVYVGEATGTTSHRGYPLVGVTSETELSRIYGSQSQGFRHSIAPSVELRYVPPVLGSAWPSPYDEVDAAVPTEGLTQAIVQVSQRLSQRSGTSTREIVRLDVGQGFDLRHRSAADFFARLGLYAGPLSAYGLTRYDLFAKNLTQISASLNYTISPQFGFYSRYENLTRGGPDRLRRGIDALVGPQVDRSLTFVSERAQQLVAGVGGRLKFGLGFRYEAQAWPIQDPLTPADPATGVVPQHLFWSVEQQIFGISLAPACDCWRLDISAILRRNADRTGFASPDFALTLVISRFGSLGVSGSGAGAVGY